ncbi:MAG: pyruvate kinase [Sphingobacteriales bacterium]|nr:MAG: pyruvate kinase [Sphingobacteriales bacterium]
MSKNVSKYLHTQMDKKAGIAHSQKRTKIVATVGPACESYDNLLSLVKAGVNVFRLNFSHGTHEDKKVVIENIRKIIKNEPYNIAILADLQGPKLRVGDLEGGMLMLKEGDEFIFTTEKIVGNKDRIYVSYENLAKDLKLGERVFLDDGKMELSVQEVLNDKEIRVRVTLGGKLTPKKGVNLPDSALTMPSLTPKDIADFEFIMTQNLDWLALSFVRKAVDIIELKKMIKEKGSKIKVISKIEMPEALKNLRDIIIESDGIMIARGDLGVEVPVEQVPVIQKDIIRKCMHRAKPVIVATQMMESMLDRTKPNRSEVSDVANAVLEGADAVMLSGETATGLYPTLVVETMSKIILEVERTVYDYDRDDILAPQPHSPSYLSDAICYSACKLARDSQANALIGMTQSGYTGFMLSSYRPKSPLYIFSKERSLISQLSLSWGVRAFYYAEEESLDDIIFDQIDILKKRGFLKKDDVVINTGSTPVELHLPTNTIKITRITED